MLAQDTTFKTVKQIFGEHNLDMTADTRTGIWIRPTAVIEWNALPANVKALLQSYATAKLEDSLESILKETAMTKLPKWKHIRTKIEVKGDFAVIDVLRNGIDGDFW